MPTHPPRLMIVAPLVLAAACSSGETVAPRTEPGPAAATAATPSRQTFEEPFAFDFSCGQGFGATNAGIASGWETIYVSGGTPSRSVLHIALRGAITNTSTGKSLTNNANLTITTDLLTGESSAAGAAFHVVSQGQGVLVLDVGIVRFDANGNIAFEGGRHDLANGEAEANECAALAS